MVMLLVGVSVKQRDITNISDNHGNGNRSYSENIILYLPASNKLNEYFGLHFAKDLKLC